MIKTIMLVPRLIIDLAFDKEVPRGPLEMDCPSRRTRITTTCAPTAMTTTNPILNNPLISNEKNLIKFSQIHIPLFKV